MLDPRSGDLPVNFEVQGFGFDLDFRLHSSVQPKGVTLCVWECGIHKFISNDIRRYAIDTVTTIWRSFVPRYQIIGRSITTLSSARDLLEYFIKRLAIYVTHDFHLLLPSLLLLQVPF